MEPDTVDPRVAKAIRSHAFVNYMMDKEIESLSSMKEIMGIVCISKKGKLKHTVNLDSVATDSSARSNQSISDVGNPCNKNEVPAWWHTHDNTLSVLSADDRISGGQLKVIIGIDAVCAAGIEGYSCHLMNQNPPEIVHDRWDDKYFSKLKEMAMVNENVSDLNNSWKLVKGSEANVHHILCDGHFGKGISCRGIDWDAGFAEFEIGTFDQIITTGNVDTTAQDGGFDMLASAIHRKLDCLSIKAGNDHSVLYCR